MAKIVALVALAVLLGTVVSADNVFPRANQLDGYTFDQYVADGHRGYARGSTEWKKREAIFNAKLASIKAHNANPAMTWKRGINEFSDWSAEEWQRYNNAKPGMFKNDMEVRDHVPTGKPSELPKTVDYRDSVNPRVLTAIKNQGMCGSCWAHSAVESMESHFAIQYGQLPVLSVQQINSCDTDMFGCGGGTYASGWRTVQRVGGLNEEWVYPYVDFFTMENGPQPTAPCMNVSSKFPTINNRTYGWFPKANVSSFTRVQPNDADAMLEAIARHGPQSISVAAGAWHDYESGIMQNNYSSFGNNITWQQIDHDVQMVGYGFDFGLNMNYWLVRNSWGTNWGEDGFVRLYRPEHEPCGDLTGQKVCGTSGVLVNPGYPLVKPLSKQNI